MPQDKTYQSRYVLCPFYKADSKHALKCEGIVPRSSINITFDTDKKKSNYMKKMCCVDYKECRIAQALYKKYEGE